jgi:hypothetical protein
MEERTILFNIAKPLFSPRIIAPVENGKISVNLQFFMPPLNITAKEKPVYNNLIRKCLDEIWGSDIVLLKCRETGLVKTLVEIAFYIGENETDCYRTIENKSRLFIERFLGVISFCAGKKLSARNVVPTITSGPTRIMKLDSQNKSEISPIPFVIPDELSDSDNLSPKVFAALFWLRRGLAERDPIDTYNAFIVCLQILARIWWDKKIASGCAMNKPQPRKCPYCENELPLMDKCPKCNKAIISKIPPPTFLFKEYITSEFNVPLSEVNMVWRLRNAIAAHGDKVDIDADDFIRLTELKFDMALWAYTGIDRALGLALDRAPKPSQDFFMTDALMNLD